MSQSFRHFNPLVSVDPGSTAGHWQYPDREAQIILVSNRTNKNAYVRLNVTLAEAQEASASEGEYDIIVKPGECFVILPPSDVDVGNPSLPDLPQF